MLAATVDHPGTLTDFQYPIYGVPFTSERLLDGTYRAHIRGFALERKQGTRLASYDMPQEIFTGKRKGDLPGVHSPVESCSLTSAAASSTTSTPIWSAWPTAT